MGVADDHPYPEPASHVASAAYCATLHDARGVEACQDLRLSSILTLLRAFQTNMPGSSLWLLPPADHPLNKVLPGLIDQTSKSFGSPHRFLPHVTLTSEISPSKYGSDGPAWLSALDLGPAKDVRVNLERLGSDDFFFRKLYIKCEKDGGLKTLAKQCRKHVDGYADEKTAQDWAKEAYMPHVSLM